MTEGGGRRGEVVAMLSVDVLSVDVLSSFVDVLSSIVDVLTVDVLSVDVLSVDVLSVELLLEKKDFPFMLRNIITTSLQANFQ